MADGKVWNALTKTSSMACYICQATPKHMNNLNLVSDRPVNEATLTFGMSPLHCWIRCFEYLLHISYRINIKKWRIIDSQDKEELNHKKKLIQEDLCQQMGLIVDVPKQGSGTTNDGNTARRFFENPIITSKITGIDENSQKICCNFKNNFIWFRYRCAKI